MRHRPDQSRTSAFNLVVVAMAALMIAASCASDGDNGTPDTAAGIETSETTTSNPSGEADSEGPEDEIVLDGGTATLTIGDQTFAFDAFVCAFGYEATQQEGLAFAAGGEGTDSDGTPIQVIVELYDAGLREGFKNVGLLRQGGSGDFSFVWTMNDTEPLAVEDPTGRAAVTLEGDELMIDGGEYERLENDEETGETAQGSLTGVCGPDSLR